MQAKRWARCRPRTVAARWPRPRPMTQENRGRWVLCCYSSRTIFYLLWRSAKACQGDGLIRHRVVGVDGITARSGAADELVRRAIVHRQASSEGNDPEVPFAAGVAVFALGMPKQISGPYAPKGSRPSIFTRCIPESTSIINPGGKAHGPAVHRYFTGASVVSHAKIYNQSWRAGGGIFNAALPRWTLRMMACADLVQTKGLGPALVRSM